MYSKWYFPVAFPEWLVRILFVASGNRSYLPTKSLRGASLQRAARLAGIFPDSCQYPWSLLGQSTLRFFHRDDVPASRNNFLARCNNRKRGETLNSPPSRWKRDDKRVDRPDWLNLARLSRLASCLSINSSRIADTGRIFLRSVRSANNCPGR